MTVTTVRDIWGRFSSPGSSAAGFWTWCLPRWLEWMPRLGGEPKLREDVSTTPPAPVA